MKYRNKRHNGYASKREADLAASLKILSDAGAIHGLIEQPMFELVPAQKGALRNERAVTYTADFEYSDDKGRHVVDAKGFKTQQYIIRRKLMKFIHSIEIEEL